MRCILKKFPESDSYFEMNNTAQDILVSGVGSVNDFISGRVLSSQAFLLIVNGFCFSYGLLVRLHGEVLIS
jgi:hypothetical protein